MAAQQTTQVGRPLRVPNRVALGLGQACQLATWRTPPGLVVQAGISQSGCASEISKGKDTPTAGPDGICEAMATTPSFDAILDGLDGLAEGGLLFASFVDFDTTYGLRRDDLLLMTGDHGCDPT
jgi:phosphopentomutase